MTGEPPALPLIMKDSPSNRSRVNEGVSFMINSGGGDR